LGGLLRGGSEDFECFGECCMKTTLCIITTTTTTTAYGLGLAWIRIHILCIYFFCLLFRPSLRFHLLCLLSFFVFLFVFGITLCFSIQPFPFVFRFLRLGFQTAFHVLLTGALLCFSKVIVLFLSICLSYASTYSRRS